MDAELAEAVAQQFRVELIDVHWHATSPGEARQVVAPSIGSRWFDPDHLLARLTVAHGTAGAECAECGVWRWMPLGFAPVPPLRTETLPPVIAVPEFEAYDVIASPEWFGDGKSAFRQILVRRDLASMVVSASPRDFEIVELDWL